MLDFVPYIILAAIVLFVENTTNTIMKKKKKSGACQPRVGPELSFSPWLPGAEAAATRPLHALRASPPAPESVGNAGHAGLGRT